MWFVFVAVALVVLTLSGLYTRRRISDALAHFGVRERRIRVVRWLIAWLLFGAPILVILSIVLSLVLGRATLPRFDGLLGSWLFTIPFAISMLVVIQATPWLLAIDLAHAIARHRGAIAFARRMPAIAAIAVIAAFALYTPLRILVE